MNEAEEFVEFYEERATAFSESLPALVREFQKSALEVSHMNDVPAAVSFFVILGQISKDFVQIVNGRNIEDSRIHFCWIQTSGTGKSTLWNFVGPVAEGVFRRINEKGTHPNLVWKDYNRPQSFDTFSLTDYTDATLIGGFNKTINDDGEVELDSVPGHLEGAGLAHWDEFEYSGVFKPTQHNESSIVYLNTLMNTLAGESWVISKALRQFDNEVKYCLSQRSTIAMTYPPENLSDVIANKGVLQRMLLYVWDVPEHIQQKMRRDQIMKAGTFEEVDQPIEKFVNGIYKVYEELKKKFDESGRDPKSTIKYSAAFNDALMLEYENMEAFINNTNGDVRKVAQNFTTRLMKILIKMSVLCCIAEAPSIKKASDKFVVGPRNVRQAGSVVRQCYSTLVDWLEQGLRVKRRSIAEKSLFPVFAKVYAEMVTEENEGFVSKKDLLTRVMNEGNKSQPSVYNYYRKIQHKFKEQKEGRSVYTKLVGDEE